MTYVMCGEIRFPAHKGREAFVIRRFSECKIESTWKSLTDTAEIVLPKKVSDFDRIAISEWFRAGDPVEIYLGYDGHLVQEFRGYVSDVGAGIPLLISCEDEMYKLKRQTVSVSREACTLQQLIAEVAPGYEVVCDDIPLGNVRYDKVAVAQILEDLQKKHIYSWFEGKVLKSAVSNRQSSVVDVQLERTAGESLKQKAVEDTLVIMRVLRKQGKPIVVTHGSEQAGKRITKEISGLEISEAELKKEAERLYREAMQPGLDGDVILFGNVSIKHGTQVKLNSLLYPEKDGVYNVDAVTKSMRPSEYRQACKLGESV